MTPVNSPGRLAEATLKQLRQLLKTLETQGADMIPAERALAVRLGVSRRIIRQALAALETEGRIQRVQGRGTLLTSTAHAAAMEELDLKQYTSPAELMETRLVLEPAVAALAATNASSQDLEDLQAYIDKSRAATQAADWERWDGALHKTIGRSTYNAMLIRFSAMLEAARAQTAWGHLRRASLNSDLQATYTRQHEAILAAIADRNPESAARAMRQHLLTVRDTLIGRAEDIRAL
ncbi:FCD domain-containing protein [uncultured Castellaniella sp.]|uniref:FadR/GntR family transcriptional regulator n=1 Tax=uncultured Castellaniella sp. TaxID=647907 RepID=UPI002607BE26|nr:FCD domain-containing protein [uncultured Castellaniella sp.]